MAGFAAVFAFGCLTALKVGSGQASAAAGPVPGTGIDQLGGSLARIANPGSFSLVIGDSADGATLAALPGRALAYFAGTDVNANWSTGVPYSQALANGWLLKDSAGNLLVNQGYSSDYVGDLGSSAYQQAWIANVLAYLSAHPGVDGVAIDDVLFDLRPLAGTEAAKYPTQQQWAAATLSFVAAVGNALHAKGYYVAVNASGYVPGDPNSNSEANTVTWWQELGPYVDGLMNEYYMETSTGTDQLRTTGTAWYQDWDGWERIIGVAQSMGKDFIGATYGAAGDTAQMTYGKASFLLEWNGGGSVFMYGANGGSDPTNAAWTTDIGLPTAAKQQVGVGWQRTYSGGIALVNPSPSSSQTFALGGSYRTAAGTVVTSLTLAPTTAAILTSATPAPVTTTVAAAPPPTTTTRTTTPAPPAPAPASVTTAPATTTTPTTTSATPSPAPPATTTSAAPSPAPPAPATTTTATPPPTTTTTPKTTTTTRVATAPKPKPRTTRHWTSRYALAFASSGAKTAGARRSTVAKKHALAKRSSHTAKHSHLSQGLRRPL